MPRKPRPSMAGGDKKPEPVDVHVGKLIKAQRLAIGMSLETLAAAIGVKFQQVQKYETGTNRVSASRLVAIAAALQVTPAFFFSDAKSGADPEIMTLIGIGSAPELLRAFAAIKDAGTRTAIVALARAIAASV